MIKNFVFSVFMRETFLGLSLFVFTFLCFALLVSPSVKAQLSRSEAETLMNRLNQLETQIQTMSRYVYKGEKPHANVPLPAPTFNDSRDAGLSANYVSQIEERLGAIENQMRSLTNSVERTEFRLQKIENDTQSNKDALQKLKGETIQPAGSSILPMVENKHSKDLKGKLIEPKPYPLIEENNPEAIYDQAFALLKDQNYDQAEKAFSSFLKQYPDDDLSDNARYWLAETYYVRGNDEKAAVLFAEAYQKNVQGNKAADNLLKLGMSLIRLGKKEDACLTFAELEKKFPNAPTPIKQRAEQQKKTAGCI